MQGSDYTEAILSFHRGLQKLQRFPCEGVVACKGVEKSLINPHCMIQSCGKEYSDCMPCSATDQDRLLYSISLSEDSAESHISNHDDVFVLFRRALHLSTVPTAVSIRNGLFKNSMSAVLLYNAGLAHHILGLQRCDSQILTSALEYYAMSYTMLADQMKSGLAEFGWISLGFLGLANNMGHIYAYFRNFSKADTCGSELSTILSNLLSSPGECPCMEDEEYLVFFMNVCFFQGRTFFAAPAA